MKLPNLSKLPVYSKAIFGGAAAGVAALSAALLDKHIDLGEVVTIVGAVLGGAGIVGFSPTNATPKAADPAPVAAASPPAAPSA